MSTIYDVVNSKMTSVRWKKEDQDRKPFLLEAWFPTEKQLGTELTYFKGKRPNVRPLDLSAYDVPALPLDREAFEKVTTDIPFFKNKMAINEKIRQELLKVLATNNQAYIDAVLNQIYNDNKTLLEDATLTREIMRAMLLTTGVVAMESNGQAIAYDYGVPDENKKTASWNNPETSTPIEDIRGYMDEIESKTGVRPDSIIMNRATYNKMVKSKALRNSVLALTSALDGNITIGDSRVKAYLLNELQATLYIYDKGYYNKAEKKMVKFFADDVFVVLPSVAVGKTVFGTTPEEADLLGGNTDADCEIVDTAVAITSWKEKDPVRVDTKVSMSVVPTLEMPETIVIATIG